MENQLTDWRMGYNPELAGVYQRLHRAIGAPEELADSYFEKYTYFDGKLWYMYGDSIEDAISEYDMGMGTPSADQHLPWRGLSHDPSLKIEIHATVLQSETNATTPDIARIANALGITEDEVRMNFKNVNAYDKLAEELKDTTYKPAITPEMRKQMTEIVGKIACASCGKPVDVEAGDEGVDHICDECSTFAPHPEVLVEKKKYGPCACYPNEKDADRRDCDNCL